jgi:hypothetical protein
LLKDVAGTLKLRTPTDINAELATITDGTVRARFLALREEAFRRLRSIEVDWSQGAFLDARSQDAGGKVMLEGEAKLHLAVVAGKDENVSAGTLFAEFRATLTFQVDVGGKQMERRCGLVCLLLAPLSGAPAGARNSPRASPSAREGSRGLRPALTSPGQVSPEARPGLLR